MLPPADDHADHIAGLVAHSFGFRVCWKIDRKKPWYAEICQLEFVADSLALYGLLPWPVDTAACFQLVHIIEHGIGIEWEGGYWDTKFADGAPDDLQETDLYCDLGARVAGYENLSLHEVTFGSALLLAVRRRAEHAKVPTLLVFHRRRAIRIQHVSLIQNCLGDLLHAVQVHDCTVSSISSQGRMCSSACSQVGMPRCIFNR